MLAFVIDPRTGEKLDFSDELNRAFAEGSKYSAPSIFRLWTPDDQYLIVNSPSNGGYLVKPRPWEIVPVAKAFVDRLMKDGSLLPAEDGIERLPWLHWLPVKGWVKMWVQHQGPGYRRGMDYFVDYSARLLVPFGDSSTPGGGWQVTPNGKHAVKLETPCRLTVRKLTLPSR